MIDLKKQKLLVIAPHPDDEVIGCGGLIKKVKDNGGKVYILYLTNGDTRDFSSLGVSTKEERITEIENVAKYLDFDKYHIAFPGNDAHLKLDLTGQKKIMDVIERDSPLAIEAVKPTIVAFPAPTSYNQDHSIAAYATHAAVRAASKKSKFFVPYVLSYEEPADEWSLQGSPSPNLYIELNQKQMDAKLNAMKLYTSQVREFPNPRSLETLKTLAIFRGSHAGASFAEAYSLYRIIV